MIFLYKSDDFCAEDDELCIYNDGSYRPVPLSQYFIGVKETNHVKQIQKMNEICWIKASRSIEMGKQVLKPMAFVLKMMAFVLQTMAFVLKPMAFVFGWTNRC